VYVTLKPSELAIISPPRNLVSVNTGTTTKMTIYLGIWCTDNACDTQNHSGGRLTSDTNKTLKTSFLK
jgi:hypothetical protein